jgi:hypothetical protein
VDGGAEEDDKDGDEAEDDEDEANDDEEEGALEVASAVL